MSYTNAERSVVGAIIVLLFVHAAVDTLGFLGVDGNKLFRHQEEQPTVVYAEKADVATPKPAFNPFTAPEAGQGYLGQTISRYYCAKETTAVDLPTGKAVTIGGAQVVITEQTSADQQVASHTQTSVTVSIKLGKKTLPGIIIHTYATLADSRNAGRMSDQTKLTRLAAGQTSVLVLDTEKYVGTRLVNGISDITFCFM